MFPYEGAERHILAIAKRHIEHIQELEPEAWLELGNLLSLYSQDVLSED